MARETTEQLRAKLHAMQARTAEARASLHATHGRIATIQHAHVDLLKARIATVHAETKAIDKHLARQDRAADRTHPAALSHASKASTPHDHAHVAAASGKTAHSKTNGQFIPGKAR